MKKKTKKTKKKNSKEEMTREFDLSDISDSQVVLLWGILTTIRFFIKSPQEGHRSLTVRNIALNQIL